MSLPGTPPQETPPGVPPEAPAVEMEEISDQWNRAQDAVITHTIEVQKNDPIGDPLIIPKDPSITRIYFQNIQGASLQKLGTYYSTLEHIKAMDVDHAMFAETQWDTTKPSVHSITHAHTRQVLGYMQYKLEAASSAIEAKGMWKPGGVMALTIGNLKGRVVDSGGDPMGRWVYTKFNCSQGKTNTIICTYQVCPGHPKTKGPTTVITQQYSMLQQAGRADPFNIRKHHAQDLVAFVQECQTKGESVIVMGDFNEVLGLRANGLTKLCSECGLKDVILDRHRQTQFATQETGSTIIDYALVAPDLEDSIVACGYEPFRIRIMGDHRGVYLDVKTEAFFGTETIPLASLEHQALSSKKPHQIPPYFQHMTKHLTHHHWFQRVRQLQECIDNNTPNHHLAQALDETRVAATQHAANHLPRYHKPPYSPEIARLRNIDTLLGLVIHQHTSKYDHSDNIASLQTTLGNYQVELPPTLQQCKELRQHHQKALKALLGKEMKTGTLRLAHQEELANSYAEEGKTMEAKRIRRQIRAEWTARVYKKCRAARGLLHQGGLSHVLVPTVPGTNPKQCNDWTRVDDPQEITGLLMERNQQHFGQAMGCTWTSPPLDITMDFEGTCHKAERILTGTADTTDLNAATIWLLDNLQYMTTPEVVDYHLTEEEFKGKIKAWDERTSTSPASNIHLGHAKAYFARHLLEKDSPEEVELEDQRQRILHGHLTLLNYALHFGYSYTRWQTIVNAMLEKDPGTPKIHRLRVIHLYEYDFNIILCIKWRQLLHHATSHHLINPHCYGSQPGKCALDAVLTKELEYELCRLTRKALVQFDNDAASCYDRIPCFLANVASRKYGMAKQVCIVQGKTLAAARYHLKTKLGISEEYVMHSYEAPWFGTGQGSGNSPMYWLVISSTIFDIYTSKSKGVLYSHPTSEYSVALHILGFVDDTNTRTGDFHSHPMPPIESLIEDASKDSQLWHDLLEASNQTLELSKCKYHVIHFDFEASGEPKMVEQNRPPVDLKIKDKTGNPVTITHLPNQKAIKYLGCLKAPNSNRQQYRALQAKCDDFARVINTSQLSKRESRVFYQAIYKLSVGYVLPVSYFTFDELDKIQRKAHRAMVSHCGYNANTAKAIVYGPQYLGGAAFFHLYDIQGLGQVENFLKFWRRPKSPQGRMLRITMAWAQMCAGLSLSIFQETTWKLPHLETKWITSLQEYLEAMGGWIEMDDPQIPPPQ